ncbi:IclR family transcriptional regulator C-terminal domain-containing protein [Streptomyces sp. NPDC057565]|uniref:IclR family transcriptional regulator domain-containing protein n=1 Tax=Streptomyces sp. NPDC057565 TaxID=3346169 RepID=UPI003676A604
MLHSRTIPAPRHGQVAQDPAAPSHRRGLLLLAGLSDEELDEVYATERYRERPVERPEPDQPRDELRRLQRNGFAFDKRRSERGPVALGVPVRDRAGAAPAGLSVSLPGVRYAPHRLLSLVATPNAAAHALEQDLAEEGR